jgi:hypothetical protein
VLEEFTDVTLGDVAEHVGSDAVGDVHGIALLHDGFRITLARAGNGERGELERSARGVLGGRTLQRAEELKIPGDGRAGGYLHGRRDRLVTGEAGDQRDRARCDPRHAIVAAVLGGDELAGGLDADLRVADVFAARGIEDAAGDHTGCGRLRHADGRKEQVERDNQQGGDAHAET